jgi:hypothetical protein
MFSAVCANWCNWGQNRAVTPIAEIVVLIIFAWLLVACLIDKVTDAIWKRVKPLFKRNA